VVEYYVATLDVSVAGSVFGQKVQHSHHSSKYPHHLLLRYVFTSQAVILYHILQRSGVVGIFQVNFYLALTATTERGGYSATIFIVLEEVVAEGQQMLMQKGLSSADQLQKSSYAFFLQL